MKSNNSTPIRIAVFFFVLFMVSLSVFLWWRDGVSAVNLNDTAPIEFSIENGEGIRTVASRLAGDGLIRSPVAFFLLIKMHGYERKIQAGEFRLSRSMDAKTVADELTHGVSDTWVTIVEGWRDEEIAAVLSKDLNIPESEFLKVAREGYMFPDTYAISRTASASAVAAMMTKTFDTKVDAAMRQKFAAQGLSLEQAVTLASIVEREGRSNTDRPVIAGILLNRLREGMPLQADATLQFSLGYQPDDKSWWKQNLTETDKQVESPYNTYLHTGLPPGPICNPGLSSLSAVSNASDTPYLYYIHDPSGAVHYAQTLSQHNANVAKYLR